MKLLPFDLSEALAHPERVRNQQGESFKEIHYFATSTCDYPVVCVSRKGELISYSKEGKYSNLVTEHPKDLGLLPILTWKMFDQKTCPVGRVVVDREGNRLLISSAYDNYCRIYGRGGVNYTELFEEYTFEDGTPCGIKVEDQQQEGGYAPAE